MCGCDFFFAFTFFCFFVQVPKDMDEEQLRPLFEQAGSIAHIMVIRDRQTDAHRGESCTTID